MVERHMALSRSGPSLVHPAFCAPGWGIVLLLSGCQVVFGEYQAGQVAAGGAGATGGTASAGGGAAAGTAGAPAGAQPPGGSSSYCSGTPAYTCSGALLQACDNGAWTTVGDCVRIALCQPALGVCDVCADGERNCSASGQLSTCNADRTGFTPGPICSSPLYCDVTADHCVACAAGQARCNGDYLDVCNADRTAWDLKAQSCEGLGCHVVDATAAYCNDCTAGSASACSSPTTLQSCVAGKWRGEECPKGCVDATPTTSAVCLN
jgi:hypothetical protein